MTERRLLAKLVHYPAFSCGFSEHRTIKLVQVGNEFRLEVSIPKGQGRWKVNLLQREVESRLSILKKSTLPAYPVSPPVCDGEFIEISIYGSNSDFTFSWWTIAPDGADALSNFVDWLRSKSEGN